jgi:tetratricopeptide (TPR) repeat protein
MARVSSGIALAVLVAALAPAAAAQTAPPDVQDLYARQTLPGYLAIVEHYRTRRTGEAVAAILAWPNAAVDRSVSGLWALRGRVRRCPVRPDEVDAADLDAAVLLHTDASAAAYLAADLPSFHFHLDSARKLVELRHAVTVMTGAANEVPNDDCRAGPPIDRRDWYLAMATILLGLWELPTADRLAQFGLEAAPGDPEMLLAAGSIRETNAYAAAHEELRPPNVRMNVDQFVRANLRQSTIERSLGDALALFEKALAARDAPLEARLRLGSVLSALGRTADAYTALRSVVDCSSVTDERYLAHLFLGRLADEEGAVQEAVDQYQQAANVLPHSQAARVALAFALDRAGEPGGRALLRETLAEPWPRDGWDDPWWTYYFGQFRQGRQLLDTLRQQVLGTR